MTTLKRYFVLFFLYCLGFALLFGLISTVLPSALQGVITIFPYLISMILLLYKFLKREQRAPTARETKAIAAGFVGVFWLYNIVGIGIGMLFSSLNDPTLWPYIFSLLKQPMFLLMASLMIVALSVPLYLITWWFYGPQAKRMAKHMGIQA